ncbi:MAG: DUF362 domain-containing protein [Sphaerobacter sp.]|nr:DUF362 domain-containing protein [Sphaerobacter sp.]
MRMLTTRRAAGLAMALGATGAAILTARQIIPTAETLLADPGPPVPAPTPKPNVYVDEDGRSLVAVTTSPDPAAGARRAIELLGGLDRIGIAGRRVLIKPNANSGYPAPASTSPAVLEAVIQLAQDHGAREVIVGELSGPPWHDTTAEMARNGLLDVVENNGARFIDFRYDRWVTVPLGAGARRFTTVSIPRSVYEAEVLIGVPALKTHFLAGYSLSVKLWFGAIHPRHRLATHVTGALGEALAELNLPFWPDLLVLDGSQALIAGGPKRGEAARTDLFLASGDRIALDVCGVAVLASFGRWAPVREVGPWQQPQIRTAIALGLGAADPAAARLVPDPAPRDSATLARWLEVMRGGTGIAHG